MSTAFIFPQVCVQNDLPKPVNEYKFHGHRKWRFDYAWPSFKVALEVEGGIWTHGAHGRGTGITRDILKYNEAAAMGWLVLRCVPDDLLKLATINYVKAAIDYRKAA